MTAPAVQQPALLGKADVIAYVGQNASRFGVDPAAMLAVANQEGLNHGPDSGLGLTWILPNEGGSINFGPPSWNSGWPGHPAAGTPIVTAHGSDAPGWSWTPAGLDYWMQQIGTVAGGLQGDAAIAAIVRGFERPREDLVGGEIQRAHDVYNRFQQQIQNPLPGTYDPGGNPIVPVPGTGQLPIPNNPQVKPSTTTAKTSPFSMQLFQLPTGPVNLTLPWDFSGITMFLAALFAIIIGALLWKPSRSAIVNVGQAGAML